MKIKKKSLQKFTKSETKIQEILALNEITPDDLKKLNFAELKTLMDYVIEQLNTLKGSENDKIWKKVDAVIPEDYKNQRWESNHIKIMAAISKLTKEFNRMATKREIAHETELSRQTINKHLTEFNTHPLYLGQIEQFRIMNSHILTLVYNCAVRGDIKAAKLYFEITGFINEQPTNNTLIQNQNNYIQINGMVLSQESIKRLNPDVLNALENILKPALQPVESLGEKPQIES